MANSKFEYVKSFEVEDKIMHSTWIVIRIDGCHFHRFSDVHEFDKPNDEQALNLMNSCAVSVLEEFPDIVFSYGVSDEYSFVMKKMTQFYNRRASKILSLTVSLFSSAYVMKWKEFFPQKELKYPPYFDGRVVCYPSTEILRDYLAWRQVDCHINNQYNTCFWMLVKSGKSKKEAQDLLKGTQTQEKNELLFQQFGINYNTLPAMFRKGSCVFRDKAESVDHLLVHCPFSSSILADFCQQFSVSWCAPQTAAMTLSNWNGFKLGKILSIIWRMAILAIWWVVWEERNERCFNDRSSSVKVVGSKNWRLNGL